MHYSDEQWKQLIAHSNASGLSSKQWCLENNISYGAYRYHKYSKGNNNNPVVKADYKLVKVKVVDIIILILIIMVLVLLLVKLLLRLIRLPVLIILPNLLV